METPQESVVRGFARAGGRQLHYRRAGSGPPVVCFHASPRSSAQLLPVIRRLAPSFTVLAFDTPGYGASEQLDVEEPRIGDYAEAVADAVAWLGLDSYSVYGFHTGALIAAELAVRHPERVTGLVVDGYPIFDDAEGDDLGANYMPAFEARNDGSHMAALWSSFRDLYVFWPPYRQEREARRSGDLPGPETLHEGVLDYLRAGLVDYRLSMLAVLVYDQRGAVERLRVPTVIAMRMSDILHPQLQRLPPLPDGVRIEDLPDDWDAAGARVAELLAALPQALAAALRAPPRPRGLEKGYVETSVGQLFVRRSDGPDGRTLVLLHASPGSSAQLEPLLRALEAGRPLLALDTPGYGESDKPPWPSPGIADFAAPVLEALDRLDLGEVDLYGTNTGALIAAEVALAQPERVASLVLDGVVLFPEEERLDLLANYAPPFEPTSDGSHLIWAWHFMRDQMLWFPWYRRTAAAARPARVLSPDELHARVVDFLKAGRTYPLAPHAVFSYPTRGRLPGLAVRTLVCARPSNPLHRFVEEAAGLVPGAQAATLPESAEEAAVLISRFLGPR